MKGYKAGPRLTLKTARALALKVTGTAKGLSKIQGILLDIYEMRLGELFVKIRYDCYNSGCIWVCVDNHFGAMLDMLFNPETLEEDFDAEDQRRQYDRESGFEYWVKSRGPDACKADIDRIWNQQ